MCVLVYAVFSENNYYAQNTKYYAQNTKYIPELNHTQMFISHEKRKKKFSAPPHVCGCVILLSYPVLTFIDSRTNIIVSL